MKIKGLIISLVLFLGITGSANAVTLVAGNTYQLLGNIVGRSPVAGYSQTYSLTPAGLKSSFTVNFDNTISVILNLVGLSNGNVATLTIDKLTLSGLTGAISMNAPATAATIAGAYKDIGNFLTAGVNTNFGIAMAGQLNTAANTWKLWGAYFNSANISLGGTDFHLTIGGQIGNTQIPEPMSVSLLGMGLLGGLISRKRKAA